MVNGKNVLLTKVQIVNTETKYNSGYWLKGTLLSDIKVGNNIVVLRYQRTDPKDHSKVCDIHGIFKSSEIIDIAGDFVKTRNSVWKVELINEEIPAAKFEEIVK